MQIQYFKAAEYRQPIKATVFNTGRLGFSRNAERQLDLANVKSVLIGRAEDFEKDGSLYLVPDKTANPDGFEIKRMGVNYYVNTKHLFETLGLDFESSKIVYTLSAQTVDDRQVFKLKRKVKELTKT